MPALRAEIDREQVQRLLYMLEDLLSDELYELAHEARANSDFWRAVKERTQQEIIRRLDEDGAIADKTDYWMVEKGSPRLAYGWDIALLERELKPLLDEQDWAELVTPQQTYKVSKVVANRLKKRGRRYAEIIERACTPRETSPPTLSIDPIAR